MGFLETLVCSSAVLALALMRSCLCAMQVGRAGRFGTKGLAISFVSSQEDTNVLNDVQSRFDVDIKPLPAKIEASTYMNTN